MTMRIEYDCYNGIFCSTIEIDMVDDCGSKYNKLTDTCVIYIAHTRFISKSNFMFHLKLL